MGYVSSQIILAQNNEIRKLMYDEQKTDREIINQLNIAPQTYYDHKRKIMKEDSKKWDLVHQDSSKYYATQLMDDLNGCRNMCLKISNDMKAPYRDRMDAYKTVCEASANIFKLLNEGLTFNVSIPSDKLKVYHVSETKEDKPKDDKDVVEPVPDDSESKSDTECSTKPKDVELIPSGHEPWGLSTTRGYNHDNRTVQYAPNHEFSSKTKKKRTVQLTNQNDELPLDDLP